MHYLQEKIVRSIFSNFETRLKFPVEIPRIISILEIRAIQLNRIV